MKTRLLAGLLMAGTLIFGASKDKTFVPATDEQIAKQIGHEIRMYTRYTIWDDVNIRVANGQVELLGAVSQPFKKSDIQRIVADVPGVRSVTNELKVLPLSPFDDRIRLQVARAIYADPVLNRYALNPQPPIHIVVDNGHVTLTGVVNTEMEKNVAGIRAQGAGLSFGPVVNNLQVEHPAPKKG